MATRAQCRRALELHELELSRIENVVGLGVVPVSESRDGRAGVDMAIAVYVSRKPSRTEIGSDQTIPEKIVIPQGQGAVEVPTRVVEIGEVVAEFESGENLC